MTSSFSADTKDALARDIPAATHCREALLLGLRLYARNGRVRTGRTAVARLIRTLTHRYQLDIAADVTPSAKPTRRCDRTMEARAAFMACGSLSAASQGYHLEFSMARVDRATRLEWILRAIASPPKRMQRNRHPILYYKDFEAIVELLTVIGAHAAVLRLEDIRALKETKNRIHRLVNTEAANLERTAAAAAKQRSAIEFIANAYGLQQLTSSLREIAQLRLLHPDESFAELGRRCRPPISKPAVSGRLAALARLADSLHGETRSKALRKA